jgi:hypothetical protein
VIPAHERLAHELERTVAGLEVAVDRIVGVDGVEYLRRYHVTDSTRLHLICRSDPQPDPHDHPWDFVTVLLAGTYREWTLDGWREYHAGDIVHRHADDAHRLELDAPVLTAVTVGPVRRRWGFHTAAGWVHWRAYPFAGRYADERLDEAWP